MIDSSIAASWSIPDEDSAAAHEALIITASDYVIVPNLFWHELRNILLMAEKRGRLDFKEFSDAIAALANLALAIDHSDDHLSVMALARRHNLTAYDAAYLDLARREGAVLATLDRKLARAAVAEKVSVLSDFTV